jgi:hypothetical protein
MELTQKLTDQNVPKRIFWAFLLLYLVPTLTAFAIGYFFLPEGLLRGGLSSIPAEFVAQQKNFWPQFLSTLGFNLGIGLLLGIGTNTQRVKGFPCGYIYILVQAIIVGVVAGTNSFVLQIISPYTFEGWLVALRIGHLEFLGYTCIVASTIGVVLEEYDNWKWKPDRTRNWRNIRFSRQEIIGLAIGIMAVIIAGYNETVLVFP